MLGFDPDGDLSLLNNDLRTGLLLNLLVAGFSILNFAQEKELDADL